MHNARGAKDHMALEPQSCCRITIQTTFSSCVDLTKPDMENYHNQKPLHVKSITRDTMLSMKKNGIVCPPIMTHNNKKEPQ